MATYLCASECRLDLHDLLHVLDDALLLIDVIGHLA